jgi:hypothetical protein
MVTKFGAEVNGTEIGWAKSGPFLELSPNAKVISEVLIGPEDAAAAEIVTNRPSTPSIAIIDLRLLAN